jgi:cyclic pyranopterin phosphate synthase
MVDIGAKDETERVAVAAGEVTMSTETLALIRDGLLKKGDVITVAEIAGVMAAKHTSELIPLCHNVAVEQVEVTLSIDEGLPGIKIIAKARTHGKTGVEMEALTAVSIAAVTVVDMVKSVEKKWMVGNIRLIEKHGGKSGDLYPWGNPL